MNKISKILLLVLMVFMAVPNLVFAEEYKVGDLVEVINQTGGESQQFYIMATEKEFEIMRSNYCKTPNRDEEVCTGYGEVDENFDYRALSTIDEFIFDEKISDYVFLVSKKPYHKNFIFDEEDDVSNVYNDESYCFFDNGKEFSYICLKMNGDELLSKFLDVYYGAKMGNVLEVLYSNNDNLIYSNSGFYGEKKYNNIPLYLSNYKNAVLDYVGRYESLRYSKIIEFKNNTLTAKVETIDYEENESATLDVYLTILMSKENIRHVVQEEPNIEEPKVEENVTKEEVTTKEEVKNVKNPSTGDVNIAFVMLGLVSFTGLALIANKKIRKVK